MTADADYAYLAPAGFADGAATVGPGDVADVIRTGLREADSPSLEAVITVLGERLLDSFSEMMEVSVTVSGPPEPSDPPGPSFSVSATFLR